MANWHTIWRHTGNWEIADDQWRIMGYDISEIADNKANVYIRWSYRVIDDKAYPYSGWNVDDIEFWGTPLADP